MKMTCKYCFKTFDVCDGKWVPHNHDVFCSEGCKVIYLDTLVPPINFMRRKSDGKVLKYEQKETTKKEERNMQSLR